ncbi:kelch repeat-containing protein [candidate division KSB1 bacterium]|nr:kelch repeat-containing protein [candidate division KSB1 bacterium]
MTVRNAHAMAYDSDRAKVILFGGADDRNVLGDLWEWGGKTWHKISATGPAPRTFPCLAYDRDRRRLVLFGGNRVLFGTENDKDTFLDDVWEWDGARWRMIETARPPARAEANMVYDSARHRLVLFGGYRVVSGNKIRLGDTWEWDGKTWEQVSASGPSPRNGAAMTYDPIRRRVILFGGNGPSGETWTWDGKSWSEVKPVVAEGRFNSAMAYDTLRRCVIRFGGWNGKERVGDTWTFDGTTWQRIDVAGPEARNHAAMVYDAKRQRLVLFGGHDGESVFGDTWEWDGSKWSLAAFHETRQRMNNGH